MGRLAVSPGLRIGPHAKPNGGGAPAVPTRMVIEGDSITSGTPDVDSGQYSYQYKNYRSDKTINVRAQSSRTLGEVSNLNDNGNSLFGNRDEDRAYDPDIFTSMIGANELHLTSRTMTQYYNDIITCITPVRNDGAKVGIAAPLPFGTNHASYANFNTKRAELLTIIEAGKGTGFDFIIPFNEHPVLGDMAQWLNNSLASDGVHPNSPTQVLMYDVFKAVIDPIFDGRTGTAPTGVNFGSDLTNVVRNGTTKRSYIVTGLGMGVTTTASVSGAGTIALGAGASGTTPLTVRNGSVVTLTVTHSGSFSTAASATVTIGGVADTLTVTTGATDPATTTWDPANKTTDTVLSNDNRDMTGTPFVGGPMYARSTTGKSSGKWIGGFNFLVHNGGYGFGLITSTYAMNSYQIAGKQNDNGVMWEGDSVYDAVAGEGGTYLNGQYADLGPINMAIDLDARKCWFYEGTALRSPGDPLTGTGGHAIPAGAIHLAAFTVNQSQIRLNAGQEAFGFTLTGFSPWM